MADLDKTIKGLECCSIAICPQILDYGKSDKGCPYHAEENCVELLAKDALELLKEKQPKKGEWIIDEYGIHHCPFCKAINETVYQSFCPNCGADMRKDSDGE